MTSFSRSSFIPKSITLNPECKNAPVVLELKGINNNMRKIDAYVVLGLKGKKKQLEDQRKKDTDSKRMEKKLGLERQRKVNPINFIKDKLPRAGFLDAIRNFILYTAMGMAVPFALKNLPKILGIVKFITPFYKVFENFAGNVLGGIASAVDFGYKVHDKIRGTLKKVTGDKFEKSFDDLEKNLNTFLNLAVVLGLAVAGSGGIPIPKGPKGSKVPTGFPPAKKILPSGSLSRVNDSYARFIAGEANIGDRARLMRRGFINVGEATTKGGTDVLTKRASPKTGGKFIGKFGRVFGRVPIVGGLIDFALSMMMGEKLGRAAARAVGASAGAALGSFIPVPGVGTILGGIIGDIISGALYDTLSSFGRPRKHATGGKVGSKSYSRIPRTIKKAKAKRPPKQLRQRTMPGKNVGGEDNIKKLFPDSDNDNTMSPLRLLKKNTGVMKKAGVFGNLLSSGVEMMALGQKIERPTLMGLEKYLAFVIDSSIDDQSAANAKMLGSSMFAMASGGIVPANRTVGQNGVSTGSVVAKEIVRSFTAMLDNRSSEIFQNIRKELELQGPGVKHSGDSGDMPSDGSYYDGDYTDLLNIIAQKESATSGGYNAYNEGGTDSGYQTVGYSGPSSSGPIRKNLTDMTIAEIMQHQANKNPPIHAAGRYQIIGKTMRGLMSGSYGDTGVRTTDKFSPANQDKLAIALIKYRLSTGATVENFINEWRGLSFVSKTKLQSAIQKAKGGNIGKEIKGFHLGGSDPITVGKSLLKMGFTVAENRFFTKFKGFNPLGSSYVGSHSNSEDHAEHSLDITDFRGEEREGIERLKVLYKSLFSRRKQLGIDELIFDPVGQWFEGMPTHSAPGNFKHPNHIHVRFKTPAGRARFRRDSGPLISSIQTTEQMNLSGDKPLAIASSPQQQRLQQISNIASRVTDIEKETQILIQPVMV
jgi:hypothetical protein